MKLTDADAEAIRVYYHLFECANVPKVASEFGCCNETVYNTINNKFHNGRKRGDTITPKCIPTPVGSEKRKKILRMLRSGAKEFNEIKEELGSDPTNYLTEMKRDGRITYKTVWCLK
jgi:hypothetical protein